MRAILNKPYNSHSSPLFHALKILKLKDIYKLQIGMLMKKHNSEKIVLSQRLQKLSNIHEHNTRSQVKTTKKSDKQYL